VELCDRLDTKQELGVPTPSRVDQVANFPEARKARDDEGINKLVASLFDVQYTGAGVEPNADAPGMSGGIYDPIEAFSLHSPPAAVSLVVGVGEVSPVPPQTFLSILSIKIRRERGIFPAFVAIESVDVRAAMLSVVDPDDVLM
jgi:hypothetical protein